DPLLPVAVDPRPHVAALLPVAVDPALVRALALPVAGDPFVVVAAPLVVAAHPHEPAARLHLFRSRRRWRARRPRRRWRRWRRRRRDRIVDCATVRPLPVIAGFLPVAVGPVLARRDRFPSAVRPDVLSVLPLPVAVDERLAALDRPDVLLLQRR